MKLEINGKLVSENPDALAIERYLKDLRGGEDNSYAILDQSEGTYMQTAGCPQDGFDLEYQDGSMDQHFRCSDAPLDLANVTRAFTLFLQGDPKFKSDFQWDRLDLSDPLDKVVGAIAIVIIIILVALVLWWLVT